MIEKFDVIIVGAGYAGLNAAYTLMGKGLDVKLLEARDRVGGRVWSEVFAEDCIIERGGQWLGPGYQRYQALAKEFDIDFFQSFSSGKRIVFDQGRVFEFDPSQGEDHSRELLKHLKNLDELAQTLPLEAPWATNKISELDSLSFQEWIDQQVNDEYSRLMLSLLAEGYFAHKPVSISLMHALYYARINGGFSYLQETANMESQQRVYGGAQLLAIKMAETLGDVICFNCVVNQISDDKNYAEVKGDGFKFIADKVIMAMPPMLAGRIAYSPAMPMLRDQLMQRTPMGSAYKIQVVYPRPFWRDQGLSGAVNSDTGPIKIVADNTIEGGQQGILVGFMDGADSIYWSQQSSQDRQKAVMTAFARYFGSEALHTTAYHEQYWANEAFSRGDLFIMPPGVWSAYGSALRAPIGRIHWAGTETATEYMNQMEGALQSGERVAAEVLNGKS